MDIKRDIKCALHALGFDKPRKHQVSPIRSLTDGQDTMMQETDLTLIVVDECRCITEWGYTFQDVYLCIGDFIQNLPHKPVICACSATILDGNVDTIAQFLRMWYPAVFRSDLKRNNLILLKKDVTSPKKALEKRLEHRLKALKRCIKKYQDTGAVMVYALSTSYVDAIYNFLDEIYPGQVARYHAKIQPKKLKRQMEMDFLQGKKKIMVAPSAFGMGIDVPDIELVIHFNTPVSMTDYIQQIGRAGRDGRKARCILFYDQNGDDQKIVHSLRKKAAFAENATVILTMQAKSRFGSGYFKNRGACCAMRLFRSQKVQNLSGLLHLRRLWKSSTLRAFGKRPRKSCAAIETRS